MRAFADAADILFAQGGDASFAKEATMDAMHAASNDRAATSLRDRLLATMPVTERQLVLAGIPTAVLEGGAGTPIVLLHGPGEYAAKWLRVIPDLASTHHVVVPDLPGHGASDSVDGAGIEHIVAWLAALIERTCAAKPASPSCAAPGARWPSGSWTSRRRTSYCSTHR